MLDNVLRLVILVLFLITAVFVLLTLLFLTPLLYHLPQAVLALKQGIGRLIRDHEDRGVAVICDPRIVGKRYGRTFLASLPPMPVTDELPAAAGFLETALGDDAA